MIIKTAYPFMKPPPSARLIRGHRLAQGLVGCWLFNEDNGLQVFDSSEKGNTGTFGAGTASPSWVPGKFGQVLSFDGEDYVSIPREHLMPNYMTFSVWVNAAAWGNDGTIFRYDRISGGQGIVLDINNGTEFRLYVHGVGSTGQVAEAVAAYNLNTWYHLCGTADGNVARLYINGIEVGNDSSLDGVISYPITSTPVLYFGINNGSSDGFEGQIDLPMVWNRALSAGEIAELYWRPFCMLERRARMALMSGYVVEPPVGGTVSPHCRVILPHSPF